MKELKTLLGNNFTSEVEAALNKYAEAQIKTGGADYIPKVKYDAINDKLKSLSNDIKDRETQIEELKSKAAGNKELLEEITKLQEANKASQAEAVKKYRDKLLELKITSLKPISNKALMAELDLTKIEFDDNDNIKGLDEQIAKIRENEDLKQLFKSESTPPGAGTGVKQNADEFGKAEPVQIKKIF